MLKTDLDAYLYQEFGFKDFRPGQAEVISAILAGQSALAVLPTGAGKTLIYQMLGRLRNGLTIIVTPLLSLMQDQVARLNYLGEQKAVALNSTLVGRDRQMVMDNLAQYRFLFISPEMLSQTTVINRLKKIELNLLVIDEAHTIISWGPDFRPEYLKLPSVHQMLGQPQLLLLTATATVTMQSETQALFTLANKQDWFLYRQSADRPNIHLHTEQLADEHDKQTRLAGLVKQLQGPGIIYVSSRRLALNLAEYLQTNGDQAVMAYHAGMNYLTRYKIQQQFMLGKLDVIVATSAFGMGIDKNDIRYVIHYHLSQDLANYLQEMGRAGRDGAAALAVTLYVPGDEMLQQRMIDHAIPTDQQLDIIYDDTDNGTTIEPQMLRLVKGYQEQAIDLGTAKRLFQERRQAKLHAVTQMISYMQSTKDLRRQLLVEFDQTVANQADQTNESSGTTAKELDQFRKSHTVLNKASQMYTETWQENLRKLFNLD